MLTLVNSLPWCFWVALGMIGAIYIPMWVIKSTKQDPIIFRIGSFLLGLVLGVCLIIDNLIEGKVISLTWWAMMPPRTIIIGILLTLVYIGGYQKAMHPGYDPEKRRTFILCSYILVATFVFLGLFFGGFHIYDNFFK